MARQRSGVRKWTFGKPTLNSGGSGRAAWAKATALGQYQKGHSGILAQLYGGAQSGDDWASIQIPVNEVSVSEFNRAYWAWYQTAAETMGLGMVVWMHDPADFDKRAEVTQVGGASGLDKAAGWNSHEFDTTVTQMFFYGEGTTGTGLTAGTQYTWKQFQQDTLFKTWTIYRVSFDWGWEASGTFESVWVSDIELEDEVIRLDPSFVEFNLKTGIGNGRGTCSAAGTANQITTTTTPCKVIIFTAETDNTGAVVLGGSGIDETLASRSGIPLLAGDSATFEIDDISKVYIDSAVTGDGVSYTYFW
jgi:hypothetical protein